VIDYQRIYFLPLRQIVREMAPNQTRPASKLTALNSRHRRHECVRRPITVWLLGQRSPHPVASLMLACLRCRSDYRRIKPRAACRLVREHSV
jgi:hypothetical protein